DTVGPGDPSLNAVVGAAHPAADAKRLQVFAARDFGGGLLLAVLLLALRFRHVSLPVVVSCCAATVEASAGMTHIPRARKRLQAHSRHFLSLLMKAARGRSAGNGR